MYNLPPKIVLVNATSGISDIFFLDSSFNNETYLKTLDSTVGNSCLNELERYFPQKSIVLSFFDKNDENSKEYLNLSSDSKKYTISNPTDEDSVKLLNDLESDDVIYFDMNQETIKVIRLSRLDKDKKIKIQIFEEEYIKRLSKLIESSETQLIQNSNFSENLNGFNNSREYRVKYRESGYIVASLLKHVFTDLKVIKELDLRTFGKSNKTNPIVVIGGDTSKFYLPDSILLALTQSLFDTVGFNVYIDYAHLILGSLSLLESEKAGVFNSLKEKYYETAFYGKYINLSNSNPLQKIYASISVKDGQANKDLFGITGTYLKYDFLEGGSSKVEILGDSKKQKILKSLEFGSLTKTLLMNFTNPKQVLGDVMKLKDYINFLNWENNIKT